MNMVCIGFYNLENLFDTIDDPFTQDEEFTPSGAKAWTQEKYEDKLLRLSQVISGFGSDFNMKNIDLLGVCEVENKKVLKDLINTHTLSEKKYDLIHHESFDPRGIDLALIYNPKVFFPQYSEMLTISLSDPKGDKKPTRGVLMVLGKLANQEICILVNHWPSRRGGAVTTKQYRIQAATKNRSIVDSLTLIYPSMSFIIMGDFNDNPDDQSIQEYLRTSQDDQNLTKREFFNPFYKNYTKGEGSLAHNNSWSLFDQILLSSDFLGKAGNGFKFYKNKVFVEDFMIEGYGHFKNHPKRSFSGDQYNYGYSDHFPVLVYLTRRIE